VIRNCFYVCVTLFVLMFSVTSCKKNNILSKGNLSFSVDTLVFDTVFTTIGSTTHQFKIYNKESKPVKIEEIELMGGQNSPFRMNIDGYKGIKLTDIEIGGKDSLFAFVEVTLKVNGGMLPLIIEDSIRFRTNGIDQYVKLAVWGQDAYFHYKDYNEGTWQNNKPHVIYGYAAVDSAKTLTIPADTKVYLHKNAILYVYKGTLNIEGELNHEVVFGGDRLEENYKDVSGQYYGIYFHQARPSSINYAIIKNGTAGIHLYAEDPSNTSYTLYLDNTIISNNARYGIFIYSGAKVKAENCVISKNESYALLVLEGGDYFFNHCDLLGYGSGTNATPAVAISNYYTDNTNHVTNVGSINEGKIYNSVIYGTQETEIAFDTIPDAAIQLNFDIRNCLIKRKTAATENYYSSIIWNSDPLFKNASTGDFTFQINSPLNGNANPNFWLPTDIKGNPRDPSLPDIGAYELN
jgi:hypothetical protein